MQCFGCGWFIPGSVSDLRKKIGSGSDLKKKSDPDPTFEKVTGFGAGYVEVQKA